MVTEVEMILPILPGDAEVAVYLSNQTFLLRQVDVLKYPETRLSKAIMNGQPLKFYRSARLFESLAHFYNTGCLHLPSNLCMQYLCEELSFWEISPDYVSPCCRKKFMDHDATECVNKIMEQKFQWSMDTDWSDAPSNIVFREIFRTLDNPHNSLASRIYGFIYMICVTISTLVLILRSVDSCLEPNDPTLVNNETANRKLFITLHYHLHPSAVTIDTILSGVFLLDITLRIVTCPQRCAFLKSFTTIVDLLAAAATLAQLIILYGWNRNARRPMEMLLAMDLLEIPKLLRFFRFLKFSSRYSGIRVLIIALRDSFIELTLLFVFLIVGMLIYGVLVYYVEFAYDDSDFRNIPVSFWWAIVTMTTVGYGDYFPKTPQGYLVGTLTAITGIIFVALPVPVISHNFTSLYRYAKKQQQVNLKTDHGGLLGRLKVLCKF